MKYHSLGKFKNKLVPVFLMWQRFSFVLRGIVSKLIIFRFIEEIIYLKLFYNLAHLQRFGIRSRVHFDTKLFVFCLPNYNTS